MRTTLVVVVLSLLLGGGFACTSDPERPAQKVVSPFRTLEQRDDVLFNLELAYNQRNLEQYGKLLDPDFVFNFSKADIDQGHVSIRSWYRPEELAATANIFNRGTLPPGRDPISSIDLQIFFTDGGDDWQAVTPPDPQKYPNETWYFQRIDYFLTVVAGDYTLTSGNPLKAEFTIRQVDDGNGTMIWRIILWQDIGDPNAS